MKKPQFTLFTSDELDLSKVVANVRERCRRSDLSDIECVVTGTIKETEGASSQQVTRKPALNNDISIQNKALFIFHSIAYRQVTLNPTGGNLNNTVTLQSEILKKVLGRGYNDILRALVDLGYIYGAGFYTPGKQSTMFKVNCSVTTKPCSNFTLLKYLDKLKKLLKEEMDRKFASLHPEDSGFLDTYKSNLNMFTIKDNKSLKRYVIQDLANHPDKEVYYKFVQETFKARLEIFRIDNNGRMYHILTNLKKELKHFLNIRVSIDCANSHPLLFSYFLYKYHRIPTYETAILSTTLRSIVPSVIQNPAPFSTNSTPYPSIQNQTPLSIHNTASTNPPTTSVHNPTHSILYLSTNLHKSLIDRNIKESLIEAFSDDELVYIGLTTSGRFWDWILDRHQEDGLERSGIKKKMFAQVFYSKNKTLRFKPFAQEFSRLFPTVYRRILDWKDPLKHQWTAGYMLETRNAVTDGKRVFATGDTRTALPNMMMKLEAIIFHEILRNLFAQGICAVHIHDAIVIPDIPQTASIQVEAVERIMIEAYARYGLCPTLKREYYSCPQ